MESRQFIEVEDRLGAYNYKPLDVVISKGRGIWLEDVAGNLYMDFLAAYSAVNQGHCHPRILKAMTDQAKRLTLTSRAFRNDQLGQFYEEICSLTKSHKVLPMNSGTEAVETAIKAVRKWGYESKGVPRDQAEIIVCDNNFHGRTITIVGFSSEEQYRDGFGPFTPGFVSVPFGDAEAFEAAITPNTVGFLVEPVQGEGGVIVPAEGYLAQSREICDRHGIMMILDEIQTGLGRTGKLFAEEHDGIEADATLVGKALSGGFYPISAVLSNNELLGVFMPGDHGSTFGGNPLACAVARESLKVLMDEGLIGRAHELGDYFLKSLKNLDSPLVKEVRGKGLLIGVELLEEVGSARPYCESLMGEGILCKETHDSVLRFSPPLVISRQELDQALEKIAKVLRP